jgi:hypothetical protein
VVLSWDAEEGSMSRLRGFMKIKLKSNLDLGGPFKDGFLELETEETTLRYVLLELAKRSGVPFIESDKADVDPLDYAISVDGCEYSMLPDRLDTKIVKDSELMVEVIMSGGG